MERQSEKPQGHLRIEIRKTSKGEYSYDTTASFSGPMERPEDTDLMETNVMMLLQDADEIARNEVARRRQLDERG